MSLQDELSFTPVTLRHNTGLRISHNGRELARMLDDLATAWPTAVEEIVLVGHSMGGLVVRSACHYGEHDERHWINEVGHMFSLGSTHLGADLEKGVNVLSWGFGRLPETRAFAASLNARSVGIKDLRYGACVDEDWSNCDDPDEFLRDRCTEVPFVPDARYYFIGATLMDGPVGSELGDLLVRIPSAWGRGNGRSRSIPFEADNGHELTGLTHMELAQPSRGLRTDAHLDHTLETPTGLSVLAAVYAFTPKRGHAPGLDVVVVVAYAVAARSLAPPQRVGYGPVILHCELVLCATSSVAAAPTRYSSCLDGALVPRTLRRSSSRRRPSSRGR